MNCLVLGGGGFIGSNLCEALLHKGHAVTIFERPRLKNDSQISSLINQQNQFNCNLNWIEGDFTNEADVVESLQGKDIVFHLVSTTLPKNSNDNPIYDIETNVVSSIKMLVAARNTNIKKVIFISSGGTVYGLPKNIPIIEDHATNPICSYGIGKVMIEKYLGLFNHLYGLDYCVLRLSNPYGQWQRINSTQGAIAVFLHRALKDEMIEIWGNGEVVRDYIYIEDAIDAIIKSISYSGSFNTFNIGSGIGHSLNDILQIVESIIGRPVKRSYKESRNLDVPVNILDISKARRDLDWQPKVALKDGISKTIEWIKSL